MTDLVGEMGGEMTGESDTRRGGVGLNDLEDMRVSAGSRMR
jgi:hypothetical protein